MERGKFLMALKAHGFQLVPGKGGETKVLAPDGGLIYGRLNLRRKTVPTGTCGAVRRGAKRKGLEFSLQEENWPVPVKKPVALEDLVPKEEGEKVVYKTFKELSEETSLTVDFLKKTLWKELPPEAFWKTNQDFVNYNMFTEWYLSKDLVPLSEHLRKIGKSYGLGQMLRKKGLIRVYEGQNGRIRVYYAEKAELEDVAKDPRKRKFGTKKVIEFDKDKYKPAPAATIKVEHLRSWFGSRKIQPDEARQILEKQNDFFAQRPIDSKHLDYLVREYYLGKLRPGNVAFVEYPNGQRKLINGQHYLNALVIVKDARPVSMEIYKVKNDKEALEAFITFDNARSSKNLGVHINGVYTIHQPPCAKKHAGLFAKALAAYEGRLDRASGLYSSHLGQTMYDDEKAMILCQESGYWPVIEFLESLYSKCNNISMRKLQVVTSVIWHFYIDEKAAMRFWKPILTGIGGFDEYEGGVYSDPRKVLFDFLNSVKLTQHRAAEVRYSERDIFQTIHKYWNIWRKKEAVGRLHIAKTPVRPK